MKIAIPVADGQLCLHFGHCEQFALVEVDAASKTIIATSYETPPPHEPGVLPQWLSQQGVEVILAGGMGMRAQELLAQNGVQVVVGVMGGSPDDIVTAYLNDTLQAGTNVCDH